MAARHGLRSVSALPKGAGVDTFVGPVAWWQVGLGFVATATIMFLYMGSMVIPFITLGVVLRALFFGGSWSPVLWLALLNALPHVHFFLRKKVGLGFKKARADPVLVATKRFGSMSQWWFGEGSAVVYDDEETWRGFGWHTGTPKSRRPHLVSYHPHGMYSEAQLCFVLSNVNGLGMDLIPYSYFQVADNVIDWAGALIRTWGDLGGTCVGNSRKRTRDAFRSKKDVHACPGGLESATLSPNAGEQDVEYILKRYGYFKYAMQAGRTLVPVFTFGLSGMYHNVKGCTEFRLWLNTKQCPGILPFGFLGNPCMPKRSPLLTVYGKALPLEKMEDPSTEQIKAVMDAYTASLTALYDKYAPLYYNDNKKHTLKLL